MTRVPKPPAGNQERREAEGASSAPATAADQVPAGVSDRMPVWAPTSTDTPDPDDPLLDPDPPGIPEADLWFLPGPLDEPPPPGAAILDPAAWLRAEAANAQSLARLALTFGELDLRLRG